MPGERLAGIDNGVQLAESMLSIKSVFDGLIAGGQTKENILQERVSYLEKDTSIQASFLRTLFQSLGKEGTVEITNRRDAALEILTDTAKDGEVRLTQAIAPIVKNNLTVVYKAYIAAVKQQTEDNDPISGSIYALLETGKAISPLLCLDLQRRGVIIAVWEGIAKKFPKDDKADERSYVYSEIKKIKHVLYCDDQVKKLRDKHYTTPQIAKTLTISVSQVNKSIQRLNVDNQIKKYNRGRKNKPRI